MCLTSSVPASITGRSLHLPTVCAVSLAGHGQVTCPAGPRADAGSLTAGQGRAARCVCVGGASVEEPGRAVMGGLWNLTSHPAGFEQKARYCNTGGGGRLPQCVGGSPRCPPRWPPALVIGCGAAARPATVVCDISTARAATRPLLSAGRHEALRFAPRHPLALPSPALSCCHSCGRWGSGRREGRHPRQGPAAGGPTGHGPAGLPADTVLGPAFGRVSLSLPLCPHGSSACCPWCPWVPAGGPRRWGRVQGGLDVLAHLHMAPALPRPGGTSPCTPDPAHVSPCTSHLS